MKQNLLGLAVIVASALVVAPALFLYVAFWAYSFRVMAHQLGF